MLIILTAWFIHNWWKLLIGLVMVIIILEGRHRKSREAANSGASDNGALNKDAAETRAADQEVKVKVKEEEEQQKQES